MGGWNFYSIERFYTAPLVYNVSCVGSALSFSTHNNFKQNNAYTGTYSVTATNGDDDDGTIASASFDFREHWRATYVTFWIARGGAGPLPYPLLGAFDRYT